MKKFPVWLIASVGIVGAFAGAYAAIHSVPDAKADVMASPAERERMKGMLANDPGLPSVAPQGFDATIVVFSDYQCPYCRKMHGNLKQLLASDRKVRIVYRDWPIFGAASLEAARAAMASRYQGKHAAFNDALMAGPVKLDHIAIRNAAERAGVDWPRLEADLARNKSAIDASLRKTGQLAETLGISGTPALVIGDYLIPGAIDAATLREVLQKTRQGAR
ncbi:DsbA family protein (plasmid) [Novosphingobium sp. BL-8A]|uniref:DsbA family protein n=1 Tax=Novosphingobium sp. BL-8A TaxID=3127639 RepID=UPI0037581D7C